ncbi:hypothetical protein [Clostridium beijerinckii]|uniref:Nucleotidyl transferase AbiEii/AbiGii toxin family protein n=1 Tax=Clostridium beijerinckii TaxID=1520 RepID=A0AAX0AXU7_CLOBE|nr:hypothetical protein [Clostridium beijerinckii]NRT71614.1 hypothetical protein [Clostridium beijerinckii]NRT87727.1 hypothetical protein [Clostridium beijerinckii]NYC73156.1 hypothetical protein [Clostridium beijerinckii]
MLKALSYIGNKLNNLNIVWGVGGSVLLSHFGLLDSLNDIYIFIDINDIEKIDEMLKGINNEKPNKESKLYSPKYFYRSIIEDSEINIIAGLKINHRDGTFKYIFHSDSISESTKINGIDIPLMSLEDWYVLYQLDPNRKKEVALIEKFLLTNDIKNPNLLERSLRGDLPMELINKIERMLV